MIMQTIPLREHVYPLKITTSPLNHSKLFKSLFYNHKKRIKIAIKARYKQRLVKRSQIKKSSRISEVRLK